MKTVFSLGMGLLLGLLGAYFGFGLGEYFQSRLFGISTPPPGLNPASLLSEAGPLALASSGLGFLLLGWLGYSLAHSLLQDEMD